jgi:hypothetical protein
MSGRDPPELIVKFWPPSVTARGVAAINAVRRPLAFAVYSRPVVAVAIALIMVFGGSPYVIAGLRLLRGLIW